MEPSPFYSFEQAALEMDLKGERGIPFVFFVDYSLEKAWVGSEEEGIVLGFHLAFNSTGTQGAGIELKKFPLSLEAYARKFSQVQAGLHRGDSFLTNLTAETLIQTDLSLAQIYQRADAAYKILVKNQFTAFSPETFVQIQGTEIASFPMKGTLEIIEGNTAATLQNDPKEKAEHATIVDLIRNDLSKVAFPIAVEKYQYVERVKTNTGELWQMSSKISGQLMPAYQRKFGSILRELLPAGSITGAPKKATMKLITEAEGYDRGFYTGIMGKFDGKLFNSGVMIRFIEESSGGKMYKSGGGITVFSKLEKEYDELVQKVYLPI